MSKPIEEKKPRLGPGRCGVRITNSFPSPTHQIDCTFYPDSSATGFGAGGCGCRGALDTHDAGKLK
jgi:hypothetical protein